MACHTHLHQHCLHILSRLEAHLHMSGMQPLALGAAMAAGAQAHIDIQGGPDARAMNNPAYYQHSEESKKLAMVRALHQAEGPVWDRPHCCCWHAQHLQEDCPVLSKGQATLRRHSGCHVLLWTTPAGSHTC